MAAKKVTKKKAAKKVVNKNTIPSWFSPYGRPYIRNKPEENLEQEIVISKYKLDYNDDELVLKPGSRYKLDVDSDLDYGGCYYPGDEPSSRTVIHLVEFEVKMAPNPYYKVELKNYEESLRQTEEWERLKKLWDEKQGRSIELAERRQLAALKKKYEKKD